MKHAAPKIKKSTLTSSISYQNKDITAKFFADGLKGKTLKAYGQISKTLTPLQ